MKDKGWGDLSYNRIEDFKDSDYYKNPFDENEFAEQFDDYLSFDDAMDDEYLNNKSGEGRDIYDDDYFEEDSNIDLSIEFENKLRSLRWSESLKSEDVKQIYPMVKRILEIYPGESADSEGIVEELERKLKSYDDIVREYIIDTLMFGDPDISFDELERKVIDLGDRIYDMGTERRMVIDAFEDAFQVIGKHFYLVESKYEENISIIIEAGEGTTYIKNRYINLDINRKLMKILDKKFNLNLGELSEKNKIDGSKVSDIVKFLEQIGLNNNESKTGDRVRLVFSGKLTLKDIKKLK